MSRAVLDLTKCKNVYRHGEITVCMTWVEPDDTEEPEPAMVFIPTYRMSNKKTKPFIIPLSSLFKYDNPRYVAQVCGTISELLGLGGSSAAIKIGDLIDNYIDELGQMPPRPMIDKYVAADAIVTDENGKQSTYEITDYF